MSTSRSRRAALGIRVITDDCHLALECLFVRLKSPLIAPDIAVSGLSFALVEIITGISLVIHVHMILLQQSI